MRPAGTPDEEYDGSGQRGDRKDGRDLIKEWTSEKSRARLVNLTISTVLGSLGNFADGRTSIWR